MNGELRAAAERVAAVQRGNDPLYIVYDQPRHVRASLDYNADCQDLAEAYIARIASDEAEAAERAKPIDEEYLRSRGWKKWDLKDEYEEYDLFWSYGYEIGWEVRLAWKPHSIYAVRMVDRDEDFEGVAESVELIGKYGTTYRPTCGQLDDLIRALKGGDK